LPKNKKPVNYGLLLIFPLPQRIREILIKRGLAITIIIYGMKFPKIRIENIF